MAATLAVVVVVVQRGDRHDVDPRTPDALVEVLGEAARVLRPGAPVVLTFSNRCFPTKAIRGWLAADDTGRCAIAATYVQLAGGFTEPEVSLRTPTGWRYRGDPLYAVVAKRR